MAGALTRTLGRPAAVASGHAYWRLYVTLAESFLAGFGTVIRDLEFRATIGGADLVPVCTGYDMSPNGIVVYSTDLSSSFAWNIFDNNTTESRWIPPNALPQWVGFHFPTPVDVQQIAIITASDPRWNPKDFKVQYSDDGSSWTDRASFSGQTLGTSTTYTFLTP